MKLGYVGCVGQVWDPLKLDMENVFNCKIGDQSVRECLNFNMGTILNER